LVKNNRTSAGSLTVSSLGNMLRAEAPTLHSDLTASLIPGATDAVTSISVVRAL
jgi:hypothetical protein